MIFANYMSENVIKLGGGLIHAGYLSGSKVIDHKAYTTPNAFDVKFLFWTPWHEGSYTIIGGRNIGLSYIILFKDDQPIIERTFWQRDDDETKAISKEIKDLYTDKLKQFAIDLAVECRERKLFEHVICTQEQLKKVGWRGEENWGDKPRLRREWLDFYITQDFKIFEVNSLFRYFMVEDDIEYEVLPCEFLPNTFIRSPHIIKLRKKDCKYPSTDYKKIHDWFANYGFDKPITFNSFVPEFLHDKDKIVEDSTQYNFMTYDEFIKALKEDKDDFSEVNPLKAYKKAILDCDERAV